MGKLESSTYVLISPARNEEKYIEKTINSVIQQKILPRKWIIVSDASTDRTDEIVTGYTTQHEFIQLVRTPERDCHSFASKVKAFEEGFRHLSNLKYEFIGNLDADVSLGPDYYARLLEEFFHNPSLGIGGGVIVEPQNGSFKERPWDRPWNVAGAIQLFRRPCYEEVGGFIPLRTGGEDTVAQTLARMRGWEVKSFPELKVFHHRPTGTGGSTLWRARINEGMRDYILGYQKTYFLAKCCRRLLEKPYIIGSVLRLLGYCKAAMKREKVLVGDEYLRFTRQEQLKRLKAQFRIY